MLFFLKLQKKDEFYAKKDVFDSKKENFSSKKEDFLLFQIQKRKVFTLVRNSVEGEPQYKDRDGVVTHIDDARQIHGTRGDCAIIPEVDTYIVLTRTK